jgi:glycosyltransferase involved in cell wall biosynthesis
VNIKIVLITHNRTELLKRCLKSIELAFSFPGLLNTYSVCIGINGNDPATKSYLEPYAKERNIEVVQWAERKLLGAARNVLIEKSKSDWIYFLDDDVELDSEHFLNFEKIIKEFPNIKVIGGPNEHIREYNQFQQAQEEVLGSFFIAGPFASRYRKKARNLNAPISQLILCNLFVAQHPELVFKNHFVGAEENELLNRLSESHRPFGFFPELSVHHERRSCLPTFYRQCIQIGRGRGQWEAQKHKLLFPYFSLWFILLFLIFCQFFAQGFILLNARFKSKKATLMITAFLLYIGYGRGLLLGAFISNKAL